MKKLLENLNKMVWKDIEKISDKELNETESELGIKFPKEDRKYIKTYNRGKAQNIYIDINGQKFNVDITTFKSKFYISNRDSFYQVTEEFFKNRNLMPIIWNMKFDAKNGEIKGILNFKNDSAYGLPQKLFKNGKLKYEFISAAEVGEKLETMTYFKEYFDKSDKLKLDCDEVSSGEWHCKEYKKDGTLKNEFTSPTYKPKKDNSFWINAFLGIWNILF